MTDKLETLADKILADEEEANRIEALEDAQKKKKHGRTGGGKWGGSKGRTGGFVIQIKILKPIYMKDPEDF